MFKHLVFLLFLFCTYCFANLPKDLDLEATYIRYINNNQTLIASDNVVLKYQGFTVTSNYFIYDIENSYVSFPKNLVLFNDTYNLNASSLEFDFKKKKGKMNNFKINHNEFLFHSEYTTFSVEDIRFKNILFTKCTKHPHDYYFTSKSLRVFPVVGYLTARQNNFKFKYLPFHIPIPFYFYGSPNNSILNNNPYLPEIGVNNTEGFFITYKTTYIPSYRTTGSFDFGYTEKLNYTLGGSNFYNQNDNLNHGLHYTFYPDNGFSSISYRTKYSKSLEELFIPKLLSNRKKVRKFKQNLNFIDIIIRNFTPQDELPVFDADFAIEKNTLINDYWVDYYPKVALSAKNIPSSKFSIDTSLQYAYIHEEDTADYAYESYHYQFLKLVKRNIAVLDSLNLHTSLFTNINAYKDDTYWSRIFLIMSIEKEFFFNPKLSLYQKLFIDGESPFKHQSTYAINTNELGLSLHETFDNLKISTDMFYKLDTFSFREFNISAFRKFHCWGAGISWGVKRNSFNILFSL